MELACHSCSHSPCHSCSQEPQFDTLPPRERIAWDDHWRVAHCFGTSLPGWLVLLPRRHVTAIADLTGSEAAALGSWQVRLSQALQAVTGCAKTYVVQFAEAPGFGHVHFHVIPRAAELPETLLGPRIFDLLDVPAADEVSEDDRDALALALRHHLAQPQA
jgi:diadenosine tetraphosphate (Ap4A) HIT family hydrolase